MTQDDFAATLPIMVKIEGDLEYRDDAGNLLGTAHISGVVPLITEKEDDHGPDN